MQLLGPKPWLWWKLKSRGLGGLNALNREGMHLWRAHYQDTKALELAAVVVSFSPNTRGNKSVSEDDIGPHVETSYAETEVLVSSSQTTSTTSYIRFKIPCYSLSYLASHQSQLVRASRLDDAPASHPKKVVSARRKIVRIARSVISTFPLQRITLEETHTLNIFTIFIPCLLSSTYPFVSSPSPVFA